MRAAVCATVLLTLVGCTASTWKETHAQTAANPEQMFERRCGGCHSLDKDKEGPRLRGVYGRKAGGVAGFDYSEALKKSGITWDEVTLNKWLVSTDAVVPANGMDFSVNKAEERTAIIAFLKSDAAR